MAAIPRGQAYLKLNKGAEAAVEFRKIIGASDTPLSHFTRVRTQTPTRCYVAGRSATERRRIRTPLHSGRMPILNFDPDRGEEG